MNRLVALVLASLASLPSARADIMDYIIDAAAGGKFNAGNGSEPTAPRLEAFIRVRSRFCVAHVLDDVCIVVARGTARLGKNASLTTLDIDYDIFGGDMPVSEGIQGGVGLINIKYSKNLTLNNSRVTALPIPGVIPEPQPSDAPPLPAPVPTPVGGIGRHDIQQLSLAGVRFKGAQKYGKDVEFFAKGALDLLGLAIVQSPFDDMREIRGYSWGYTAEGGLRWKRFRLELSTRRSVVNSKEQFTHKAGKPVCHIELITRPVDTNGDGITDTEVTEAQEICQDSTVVSQRDRVDFKDYRASLSLDLTKHVNLFFEASKSRYKVVDLFGLDSSKVPQPGEIDEMTHMPIPAPVPNPRGFDADGMQIYFGLGGRF